MYPVILKISGFSVSEDIKDVITAVEDKLAAPPCNNTLFPVKDAVLWNLHTSVIKVAFACKDA